MRILDRRNQRSRGAILIGVLVCLAVAMSVMVGIVVNGLQTRRQLLHESQLQQTRMLLEAGLVRAAKRYREDDQYTGETWRVSPALSEHVHADLVIVIDGPENESKRVKVTARIQGTHPADKATQRSREIILPLSISTKLKS